MLLFFVETSWSRFCYFSYCFRCIKWSVGQRQAWFSNDEIGYVEDTRTPQIPVGYEDQHAGLEAGREVRPGGIQQEVQILPNQFRQTISHRQYNIIMIIMMMIMIMMIITCIIIHKEKKSSAERCLYVREALKCNFVNFSRYEKACQNNQANYSMFIIVANTFSSSVD